MAAAAGASAAAATVMEAAGTGATLPKPADFVSTFFPSSRVFASAWSDEAIVRAFPLREQMWADGFEHVWLRCDEKAISNT